MKNAFLFSGQGSQAPGMGGELLERFPSLKSIFDIGSEVLGYDLLDLCLNADAETLGKTRHSQPAIFAVSLLCLEAVKAQGITPDMTAGHSLGEYAAMVAAGILTVEDGFFVIKERALAMEKCAEAQEGAMCAVLGLSADEIARVCSEIDGYVIPVNYNSPAQTVIAGDTPAVEAAMAVFTEMGKRVMRLGVSAAFHSKQMQPAADEFKAAIKDVKFSKPQIPFYSNLTGEIITDAQLSDMASYLACHIVSPVRFTNELEAMQKSGAERFIECGPGKVLTGLVKKTLEGVECFPTETSKGLDKLISAE